jgi:hypothetical protein
MTIMRINLIAALGLLATGALAPASAGPMAATKATIEGGEVTTQHLVTDRGSWIEPKHSKRGYRFDDHRRFDRYDDHRHHRKHYGKKKKRKAFKRGYSRGYDRGYEEGYYDARKRAYHKRHRHHRRHYEPWGGFRGGIYFGDNYYGRRDFRFRY